MDGVDGLEQAAHGEVAPVQGEGVGMSRPLLVQQGGQPGVAAVFAPGVVRHGEEMVVGVVGKQNGALIDRPGRGGACREREPAGGQAERQSEQNETASDRMPHEIPSSPLVCHISTEKEREKGNKILS